MRPYLSFFLLLVAPVSAALAEDWPAWRGPRGDGHATAKELPLQWSAKENVRWKTPLPDDGNSTPVVWGDRIFLTQATDRKNWPPKNGRDGPASAYRRIVMCLQRSDGKVLWEKETEYKELESTHNTNPFCSASPVTDGKRVIASLGSAGMVCYDFEGKELWRKDLGKLEHIWGNASSPILYGDLCILWCGPGKRQFLLAVNKTNGDTVWETEVPGGNDGNDKGDWRGSWSTPLVIKAGDRDEMIVPIAEKLKAFDPKTGKELWSCDGSGKLAYTSPVYADGIVVYMSGFSGPALAVKTGGSGDVTKTHRLWHHTKSNPQRIGSPVIVGEHVYIVNDNGTAQCFELKTGKELWDKERAGGGNWGSLVAVDDKLYVTNMAGETQVLAAKPKFEILAQNKLGERVLASIAVADDELFIRTYKHLWCIGKKK